MKINLKLLLVVLSAFSAHTFAFSTPAQKQPNIIIVLADDLGYADVGFNGAKDIKTPELDDLASKGTKFTSAYVVHPFCGPSRMGMFSGRYPHKFGGQFNLPQPARGYVEYNKQGIDVNEVLMGNVLQDAGYYTGAVGKWHMGRGPKYHPNVRGFDDYYGFLDGGHRYFPEDYEPIYNRQVKAGNKLINSYLLPLEHNGKEVRETEYMTDALSREASRFITQASAKDKPFFLYVAYNAPHAPMEAKAEDMAKFAFIKDKKRRTYAAMVYAVDRGVGDIVKTLKATGEYENTLIVFLSDNGGKPSQGADNSPLRGQKGDAYEGGFRVPMLFHWPNKVPAGKVFNYPVSALDFYPTFAHLAEAKIPATKSLDGVNIWEDLLAGKNPRQNNNIYVMRYRGANVDIGVRMNEWKATKVVNQPWKLFNINNDISESKDISAKHPELLAKMVKEAEQFNQSHHQPIWFDSEKAGEQWLKDQKGAKTPVFKNTFDL